MGATNHTGRTKQDYKKIKIAKTFGDVKAGEILVYPNSVGQFAVAINMGNFAKTFGVKTGDKITLKLSEE